MKGVIRDRYGFRAYVKVHGIQREKRYPPGTPAKTMQAWRDDVRLALRLKRPRVMPGTYAERAKTYLATKKAELVTSGYRSLVCEVESWLPVFGALQLHQITREQILAQRTAWLVGGYAPKTCNHRLRALRALFRHHWGSKGETPCDDIDKLAEPPANPQFVPVTTIRRVAARLTDPKARARFMVLTSTGQRPAQVKRALPGDVDLRRGVWMMRPAKGGTPVPVILTDDMRAAFKAFRAADAWGYFDGSDYAKALYAAGWPRDVRPYNAKHTVAIALAEDGAEWEDIKDWFGHRDVKTTRIYTGLVLSRFRKTAQRLQGRIGYKAS